MQVKKPHPITSLLSPRFCYISVANRERYLLLLQGWWGEFAAVENGRDTDWWLSLQKRIAVAGLETNYQFFLERVWFWNWALYYFGHRYDDPLIGQWLVPDPAGQGFIVWKTLPQMTCVLLLALPNALRWRWWFLFIIFGGFPIFWGLLTNNFKPWLRLFALLGQIQNLLLQMSVHREPQYSCVHDSALQRMHPMGIWHVVG